MRFTTHIFYCALYVSDGVVDLRNPFGWTNLGHAEARWGLVSAFRRAR